MGLVVVQMCFSCVNMTPYCRRSIRARAASFLWNLKEFDADDTRHLNNVVGLAFGGKFGPEITTSYTIISSHITVMTLFLTRNLIHKDLFTSGKQNHSKYFVYRVYGELYY